MNWCLEEIAKHIIEFYEIIKCTPEQIKKKNLNNIKQSFNKYNDTSVCIFQSYINPLKNTNILIEKPINNDLNVIKEEIKEEKNDTTEENKKTEKEDENKKEDEVTKGKDGNQKGGEKIYINGTSDNMQQKVINPFKKYTPRGSINENIPHLNNPYNPNNIDKNMDVSKLKDDKNNEITPNRFKITPGNSIWKLYEENPYTTKGGTIEDNKNNKKCTIPSESIRTSDIKIDNPYKNNIKKEKNDSENKIDSNYISTKESGQTSNNISIKNSEQYKLNNNYSIDNY